MIESRNYGIDNLKILMAFCIVLLHTGAPSGVTPEITHLLSQGLYRVCVPIFFLISGFYYRPSNEIISKRLLHLIQVFLTWTLVFLPFWYSNINFDNALSTVTSTMKMVLYGYFHLWYVSALIITMLTFSTLKLYNFNHKNLLILATVLFLIGALIQHAFNYQLSNTPLIHKILGSPIIHRNFIFVGVPFFIIGYILKNSTKINDHFKAYYYIYLVVGILLLFAESTCSFFLAQEKSFDIRFSLWLLAPSIFFYFKNLKIREIFPKTSALAGAIYFSHPLVLFSIFELNLSATINALIAIPTCMLLGYLILSLNNKLKVFI